MTPSKSFAKAASTSPKTNSFTNAFAPLFPTIYVILNSFQDLFLNLAVHTKIPPLYFATMGFMNFDDYQQAAIKTNLSKDDQFKEIMQQVLGLADESGEVLAIFKKWIRDNDADITKLDIQNVKKELGDILWYIAVVANDLGISFNDLAQANIDKLASRQQRGTLTGSGDNR